MDIPYPTNYPLIYRLTAGKGLANSVDPVSTVQDRVYLCLDQSPLSMEYTGDMRKPGLVKASFVLCSQTRAGYRGPVNCDRYSVVRTRMASLGIVDSSCAYYSDVLVLAKKGLNLPRPRISLATVSVFNKEPHTGGLIMAQHR